MPTRTEKIIAIIILIALCVFATLLIKADWQCKKQEQVEEQSIQSDLISEIKSASFIAGWMRGSAQMAIDYDIENPTVNLEDALEDLEEWKKKVEEEKNVLNK